MPLESSNIDLNFGLDAELGSANIDLDFDFGAEPDEAPDPLEGYQYTGDIERDSEAEMSAVKAGFIARAKAENSRRQKATDSEYWVCLCFQSRTQVEEFLRKTKWGSPSDKYLDGQKVAKKLAVDLTPEPTGFGRVKIDSTLANLALEI
jgi:hypothetical protein